MTASLASLATPAERFEAAIRQALAARRRRHGDTAIISGGVTRAETEAMDGRFLADVRAAADDYAAGLIEHHARPTVPAGQEAARRSSVTIVSVRWFDAYQETFEATKVRSGSDLLWLRCADGSNRHIPLRAVRWFSLSKESHGAMAAGGDAA